MRNEPDKTWVLRDANRTCDLMAHLIELQYGLMDDLKVVEETIAMCEADEAFVKRFNLLAQIDKIRERRGR